MNATLLRLCACQNTYILPIKEMDRTLMVHLSYSRWSISPLKTKFSYNFVKTAHTRKHMYYRSATDGLACNHVVVASIVATVCEKSRVVRLSYWSISPRITLYCLTDHLQVMKFGCRFFIKLARSILL